MPPLPSKPPTLQQEFDRFITSVYPDPPTQDHPADAVRDQYGQLREAFFAGCLLGVGQDHDYLPELLTFGSTLTGSKRNPFSGEPS